MSAQLGPSSGPVLAGPRRWDHRNQPRRANFWDHHPGQPGIGPLIELAGGLIRGVIHPHSALMDGSENQREPKDQVRQTGDFQVGYSHAISSVNTLPINTT